MVNIVNCHWNQWAKDDKYLGINARGSYAHERAHLQSARSCGLVWILPSRLWQNMNSPDIKCDVYMLRM